MQASFIYGDPGLPLSEINSSRYRVLTPAKYLSKAGHTIHLQSNPPHSRGGDKRTVYVESGINYSEICDTVLIERNLLPGWVEKLRLSGARRIVATFDDHYGLLQSGPHANVWWTDNFSAFTKALGMVDLVIVPSQLLVDTYKKFCQAIVYVPNFIDDDLWESLPPKPEQKSLGWGGSVQHLASWQQPGLTRALARILKENPDWQLRLIGKPEIIHNFPDGVTAQWHGWVTHAEWPERVSEFTIGLAPLHGEYDNYRSNLKLVEYGCGGVPWVASFAPPYSRSHVRGGILVKERESDWYEALHLLVHDEKARQTLSAAGRAWADGYRMSKNVPVYENLIWPEGVSCD